MPSKISASSPTGPAFEGAQIEHGQRAAVGAIERVRIDRETGQPTYKVIGDDRWSHSLAADETLSPTGICGSGIIEVIAELFLAGVLNPQGQFASNALENPYVRPREKTAEYVLVPAEKSANGKDIVVTQQDIRAIQLAKGALYAGIRLLMDHMQIEQVDEVKLAGGFGSYIDPKYAMILGLIPDCDLSAVSAVGNAAGDGALIALLNITERTRIQEMTEQVHYVETAVEPAFQDHFVAAMAIPHASAPYPHLADILPAPVAAEATTGRRRNRRRNR
ncbi:MAG: ATP-binding protein [Chloroflexota bacterium]